MTKHEWRLVKELQISNDESSRSAVQLVGAVKSRQFSFRH
jgi:hypothetical protein